MIFRLHAGSCWRARRPSIRGVWSRNVFGPSTDASQNGRDAQNELEAIEQHPSRSGDPPPSVAIWIFGRCELRVRGGCGSFPYCWQARTKAYFSDPYSNRWPFLEFERRITCRAAGQVGMAEDLSGTDPESAGVWEGGGITRFTTPRSVISDQRSNSTRALHIYKGVLLDGFGDIF